jgi:acetyl esterase/lipase
MRPLSPAPILHLLCGGLLAAGLGLIPDRARAQGEPAPKRHRGPVVPADVSYLPNLTYGMVSGKELHLDLACPRTGAGPFPAVVLIHGTGPLNRGRKGTLPLAFDLAAQGYVIASVSYRHTPEDGFPAALADLKSAIRWLRAHAGEYHINQEHIAALGFSGGGGLACLLALTGLDGADLSSRLQAVVSYFPPTDLVQLHASALASLKSPSLGQKLRGLYVQTALEKWLGGGPVQVPRQYASASPISYVRKGAPPILLIHGTADIVVPVEQSRMLAQKLREVGGQVSLLMLEQAPHDFDQLNTTDAHVAAAAVRAFLDEYLRRPAGPK